MDSFDPQLPASFDLVFVDQSHYLEDAGRLFKAIYYQQRMAPVMVAGVK